MQGIKYKSLFPLFLNITFNFKLFLAVVVVVIMCETNTSPHAQDRDIWSVDNIIGAQHRVYEELVLSRL